MLFVQAFQPLLDAVGQATQQVADDLARSRVFHLRDIHIRRSILLLGHKHTRNQRVGDAVGKSCRNGLLSCEPATLAIVLGHQVGEVLRIATRVQGVE